MSAWEMKSARPGVIIILRKRNKPRHTQKNALYEYIRRRSARTTMVFAGSIVLLIGSYSS